MKRRAISLILTLALLLTLLPGMGLHALAEDAYAVWPEMTGVLSVRYTVGNGQVTRLEVGDTFHLEFWLDAIDPYAITVPVNWDPTVVTMVNDRTGEPVVSGLKSESQIGDGFRAGGACYDDSYDDNWLPLYWNGTPVFSRNSSAPGDGYPYIDNENGHCHFFFFANDPTMPAQPQLFLSLTFKVLQEGDPNFHIATEADFLYDPTSADGMMLGFRDSGVVVSNLKIPPVYIISSWTDITPIPEDPGIGRPGNVNGQPINSTSGTGSTGSSSSGTATTVSVTKPATHSVAYPYKTPVYTDAVIRTSMNGLAQKTDNYILTEERLATAVSNLLQNSSASAIVVRMPDRIIDKTDYTIGFSCAGLAELAEQRAAILYIETPYGYVGVNTSALMYEVDDRATMVLSVSPVKNGIRLNVQVNGKTVEGFSSPVFLMILPYQGEEEPCVVSSTVLGAANKSAGNLPLSISRYFEAGAVSFLTPSGGTYVIENAREQQFSDVPDSYWGYEAISMLTKARIVSGKSEDQFEPESTLTRAELAKLVTCTLSTYNARYTLEFEDVSAADWFCPYVGSASSLGIVRGSGDGTFLPYDSVTRQDMAVMAWRGLTLLGVELPEERAAPEFTDADSIADYAKEAVTALYRAGILNGMGDGAFAPDGTATRAQAAQLILGMYLLVHELI